MAGRASRQHNVRKLRRPPWRAAPRTVAYDASPMVFSIPHAARFLVATLGLSSLALAGGKLKGKVEGFQNLVSETQSAATKSEAHRFQWREGSPSVKPEFRTKGVDPAHHVVVALLAAKPVAAMPVAITLAGLGYLPATFVVAPSTALRFTNTDVFPHKPIVVGVAEWKPEVVAPTGRRDWTAPASASVVELRDGAFPSARGFLVVEPNVVATAMPSSDGSFTLDAPAGEYTLRAYFEGKALGEARTITIADGAVATLPQPFALTALTALNATGVTK